MPPNQQEENLLGLLIPLPGKYLNKELKEDYYGYPGDLVAHLLSLIWLDKWKTMAN